MPNFEILNDEVNLGMEGRNNGIPMSFPRLNNHIGIRKRMYFLIGGNTGSGKTSFLDDAFVLNPIDWYLSPTNKSPIKLKIVYRSMERSRVYKLAKWVIRKIFLEHGIIVPMRELLGWGGHRLSKDHHDLYLLYKDYMGHIDDIVEIFDGPENPVGVAKDLQKWANKRGKVEELDQFNKVYIPDNPNEIVIVALDHFGLLKTTKDLTTKKAAIDKMSDEFRYARDFYGYVPVGVSQFNRDISNPIRIKNGDVEPQLEDFKESGQTQDDADVVVGLFDPMRYKVDDPSGYILGKLKDDDGNKYFRSIRVIKNSYGADDLRIGLGFLGQVGTFRELPRKTEMTDADYEEVINHSFFLNRQSWEI